MVPKAWSADRKRSAAIAQGIRGYNSVTFKVCKSVHHHVIQINQPTRCNNFSSLLLGVYVQLNMFWVSSHPSSGAQQLQLQPLVLPLESGDSTAITTLQRLNQRLLLQLLSSWGWARGRPKQVELYITSSNELERLLHLVGWFIWKVDLHFLKHT